MEWLARLANEQIFLSAEMQPGVERTRLQHSGKAVEIEVWIAELSRAYRVLPKVRDFVRLQVRLFNPFTAR